MTRAEKILSNIMQRVHEAQGAWYTSNWNRLGLEPYGMEGDTDITTIPDPQYQTHVQGALPSGGAYGNITPFAREQKVDIQEGLQGPGGKFGFNGMDGNRGLSGEDDNRGEEKAVKELFGLLEAEEEKDKKKATSPVPEDTAEGDPFAAKPAAAGGDDPFAVDPAAGGAGDPDPAAGGDPFGGAAGGAPGMDPSMGGGMGGMGMGMEPRSATELGKIYELKKIYTRLASIESYLATEASVDLQKIRGFVAQAIEMFEIIASNLYAYKDKMDEIIVIYYKFLLEVYDLVRTYYKRSTPKKEDR